MNDVEYQIGDCVMVRPDIKGSASYIGRIVYLLEVNYIKIKYLILNQYLMYFILWRSGTRRSRTCSTSAGAATLCWVS